MVLERDIPWSHGIHVGKGVLISWRPCRLTEAELKYNLLIIDHGIVDNSYPQHSYYSRVSATREKSELSTSIINGIINLVDVLPEKVRYQHRASRRKELEVV